MKVVWLLLICAAGTYAQSCAGRCGERDDSKPCNCNSSCENYGDCCSDYFDLCYSCDTRCGESYVYSKPCQCNDDCSSHHNCCSDYDDLCGGGGGGGASDTELREFTESIYAADVNSVGSQLTIDHQGQSTSGDSAPLPYFTDVPESALSGVTITALKNLQDNYVPDVTVGEVDEGGEAAEVEAFLDAVMATEVMTLTEAFLVEHEIYTGNLRDKIKEIWFDLYPRSGGPLGSSGFEHSFVGELKNGKVSGFHNWVYFYHEESAGNLNYEGWNKLVDLGDSGEIIENHFIWLDEPKAIGGMFTGTSPELDLATYTVCFLTRPDSKCPVQMNTHQFQIQTWTLSYGGKVLVGSAYPMI